MSCGVVKKRINRLEAFALLGAWKQASCIAMHSKDSIRGKSKDFGKFAASSFPQHPATPTPEKLLTLTPEASNTPRVPHRVGLQKPKQRQ